jgi:hypothetical protein
MSSVLSVFSVVNNRKPIRPDQGSKSRISIKMKGN